ncbi:hypothetical protein BCR39DRAFT_538007 [Naematelia encephala]|uniref:GATA-type domain-containing protein n=1 Tax=Naematelia encephala TaxID=71784 RepID=A0A1Y2AYA3_9TREE|nr:hypothetical protein BCR39DRAFT_538007 [Naematelia encephala]
MNHPQLPRGPPPLSTLSHSFDDTPSSAHTSTSSSSYSATPRSTNSISDLPFTPNHHHRRIMSPSIHTHLPPPSVPSTFLPSYYPESRNNDALPSHLASSAESATRSTYSLGSSGHLLDGVAMKSPPRQPRHTAIPTYEISSPDAATRSLLPAGWDRSEKSWNYWGPSCHLDLPDSLLKTVQSRSSSPRDGGGSGAIDQHATSPPHNIASPQPHVVFHPPRRSFSVNGSDAVPNSSGYPGMLYDNVPLPDGMNITSWGASGPEGRVSGDDYAQVLAIYQHILSALPHVQPSTTAASPGGAPFDHLVSLAIEAQDIISGQSTEEHTPDAPPSQTPIVESRSTSATEVRRGPTTMTTGRNQPGAGGGAEAKKGTTKCLGCGATETPEWRRGPMGPRTLCNACGLVHMKLQRKRRKQEEKAAAAAAAAAAGAVNGSK